MTAKNNTARVITAVILIILSAAIVISFVAAKKEKEPEIEERWPLLYEDIISRYSEEYRVPMEVIYATVKAESRFDPEAVSYVGARGLMQIMPSTYEWLCSKGHLNEPCVENGLFDPETNIRVGCYYLSWLYGVFGDWELVSAAYNAGHGAVKKWMQSEEYYKDGELYNIPNDETRNYVYKVDEYKKTYKRMYADRAWNDYSDASEASEQIAED